MTRMLDPWRPGPGDPFDLRKAGHLLRRAAFGGSLTERRRLVGLGVARAVDSLFDPRGPGEPVDDPFDTIVALDDIERLRAYRLWRIMAGRERLKERMSYFWHGHFATSNVKVKSARLMALHWAAFDAHGLGRFDDLLLAVSRDPAMLRWLDSDTNVAASPNENYARELFELFALGRGNYTEHDIREAARAFTGWHIRDLQFRLSRPHHDDGEKTVFGRTGRFGGEDIVAMTVRRPESARFVARKLLAFFVHPEPAEDEIAALADCYSTHERNVGDTLRVLLRSRLFFAERAYRSRIKDPVDLVVGLVRGLGATAGPRALEGAAAEMGQTLCEPPSVEGWHCERAWISSATWLLRSNFAAELFAGTRYGLSPPIDELAGGAADPRALALDLLLDGVVSDGSRSALDAFLSSPASRGPGGLSAIFHAVQELPEGQLL